jgi:hypothetical protein
MQARCSPNRRHKGADAILSGSISESVILDGAILEEGRRSTDSVAKRVLKLGTTFSSVIAQLA